MLHMETISSFNPLQREHERLVILTNKKDLAINALKVQLRMQNFACVINKMFILFHLEQTVGPVAIVRQQ